MSFNELDWFNLVGRHKLPEEAMWGAVILRALMDVAPRNKDCGGEKKRNYIAADEWFRRKGRDFQNACHFAGFDPDFLHEAYTSGRLDNFIKEHWVRTERG